MTAPGYNRLRWDCEASGCFNIKRRPKIEVFAECFPRRINFGDVDGLVEMNGSFLILEWKGAGGSLGEGQRRSLLAFSRQASNLAVIVEGEAETMETKRLAFFWRGAWYKWRAASLHDLKHLIARWAMHQESRL